MKVLKNQNPSYILGYLLELIIKIWQFGRKKFFKIWRIWAIFFPWEILCIGQNHIFQVKIWRNLAPKKRLVSTNVGPLLEIGTYPPWLSGGLGFMNMILKNQRLGYGSVFFSIL
jgi:hypothetical protein